MAEVGEDSNKDVWGTWEELLLVYAVDRHGTKNWDSVAMEIQNRITSSSSPNFILTPHNCKQKYLNLRRRFKDKIDDFKNESEIDNKLDDTIPWLEELRKLRVAELRREVQQKDVKIVSLELKVKRLTEERERSSNEKENGEVKLDLERLRPEPEENGISEPVNCSKPISGEDSDRENQSFNESNSTDPKQENRVTDVDESNKNKKIEPDEIVAGEQDPVKKDSPEDKPAGEGSYNGSSETILKDSVSKAFEKSSEAIPETEPGESPELWESVTDSKEGEGEREAEGAKENSDVQSSASLSKENRRKKDTSVSSSGEEPETDEISPAIKRISVKSHPLAKVLEIIKSNKYGYVFERRLESQETSKYKSMIRQHLDLETINKRFKAGHYSGCSRKFFRDMLLLVNNAIVFFPTNSVEVLAAMEFRQLIQKEIGSRMRKANKSVAAQPPRVVTASPPSLPKTDPEPSSSLLAKAKSSVPIIACRKRSSIASKGPNGSGERKAEKKEVVVEEKKPIVDRKQQDDRVGNFVQEQIVIKKGKRDRPTSGARSSRPVGKNNINSNPNKHTSSSPNQNPNPNTNPSSSSKGGTPVDDVSEKGDKEKKGNVNTVAKKRSVANFLDRMQKNNSSNGTLLDSLKNSGNNSNNNNKGENKGGNAEQKKNSGGKGEGRKEQATKQSSSKKHSRDKGSPPKRSVGRPPKRNASSSSPATPPPPSKRSRETAEMEEAASKQPRKRSRR